MRNAVAVFVAGLVAFLCVASMFSLLDAGEFKQVPSLSRVASGAPQNLPPEFPAGRIKLVSEQNGEPLFIIRIFKDTETGQEFLVYAARTSVAIMPLPQKLPPKKE